MKVVEFFKYGYNTTLPLSIQLQRKFQRCSGKVVQGTISPDILNNNLTNHISDHHSVLRNQDTWVD